jgi:hypothetical protein
MFSCDNKFFKKFHNVAAVQKLLNADGSCTMMEMEVDFPNAQKATTNRIVVGVANREQKGKSRSQRLNHNHMAVRFAAAGNLFHVCVDGRDELFAPDAPGVPLIFSEGKVKDKFFAVEPTPKLAPPQVCELNLSACFIQMIDTL